MTWTLAHIFRHPVKSLGEEELERVDLARGKAMPFDRRWAIAHGDAGDIHGWARAAEFVTVRHAPRLAQVTASFSPHNHIMRLSHPDLPDLDVRPGSVEGDDNLAEWIDPLVAGTRLKPPFLIYEFPEVHFTDLEDAHISIGSETSRRALEELAGWDMLAKRFRMNLWIDGMEPWQEFDLIGREIEIGETRLKITERVTRCATTTASPITGTFDIEVPKVLHAAFGHMDFGVYAQVTKTGPVARGDEARLV